MDTRLRILILDDETRWLKDIEGALRDLGEGIKIKTYLEMEGAQRAIENETFDIAVVDLSLKPSSRELPVYEDLEKFDTQGLRFLEDLKKDRRNSFCAVIIITGKKRTSEINLVLTKYKVSSVIEKKAFSDEVLIGATKSSLLEARAKRAEHLDRMSPILSLQISGRSVTKVEFIGGTRGSAYQTDLPNPFNWKPLANQVDLIEHALHSEDPSSWRLHSKNLGSQIHRELTSDPGIQGVFSTARYEAISGHKTRYRFASPTEALGTPFEMIRQGEKEDLLCLEGPVSRQVIYPGQVSFRRIEAFHQLLTQLGNQRKPFRILFVAANVDGEIPGVDQEVAILKAQLKADFGLVGVDLEAEVVGYGEATFGRVSELLQEESFHIFHYAGHGLHRVDLPEASGLVLRDRVLNSADLKNLAEKTKLQLVFLSSCLGARTAPLVGRGDFHGVLEALARAGVPTALGYRWIVSDHSAQTLASAFYRSLIQTFSPEEALYEARRKTVLAHGRDDPTWASPILLLQK